MGSDLYMEERSFNPRAARAEWDGDELVIYHDVFYHGWQEYWRGKVTDSNRALVSKMVRIPHKLEHQRVKVVLEMSQKDYDKIKRDANWFSKGDVKGYIIEALTGRLKRNGC